MRTIFLMCMFFIVYCFAQIKDKPVIGPILKADTVSVTKQMEKVYVPPVPAGSTYVNLTDRYYDDVPPGFEVEVEYTISNNDTTLRYYKITYENPTADTMKNLFKNMLFR